MNHRSFSATIKYVTRRILARRTTLLCTIVGFTLGLPLIGVTPLAALGCQPLNDAMDKIYTTPTHIYSTLIVQDPGEKKPYAYKSEEIYAGGVIYEKSDGKWARLNVTLQQVMKREENDRRNRQGTCRYLRDESVNGGMAAVYSTHGDRSDVGIKSDGQVWISKTKGLPLRDEADIDSRDHGKSHVSTRYEYTNVQPPL